MVLLSNYLLPNIAFSTFLSFGPAWSVFYISCDSFYNTCRLQTALHKAAWYGYGIVCQTLVERGASLTRADYQVSSKYPIASFPDPYKIFALRFGLLTLHRLWRLFSVILHECGTLNHVEKWDLKQAVYGPN